MGGKRISDTEIQQIETFISEGLTCREIAEKLGRSEAGIRNIRYRKNLIMKAEDESKFLFQQRDQLRNAVLKLQAQRQILFQQITGFRKEKDKLEALININKILLQNVLAQSLTNLKLQRPDLFYMTGQDQIFSLTRLFLNLINK